MDETTAKSQRRENRYLDEPGEEDHRVNTQLMASVGPASARDAGGTM